MTTAGVGFSEQSDSYEAGLDAARQAMAQAGGERCDLALLFSTSRHDQALLHRAVRETVGPAARIAGGCGMGVISNDRLGYDGCQVGVAVLASDTVKIDIFVEEGLGTDEYQVGLGLGRQVAAATTQGERSLLLLYDAVRRPVAEGLAFTKGTPLLRGIDEALGEWPAVAGCGLVGDQHFNRTQQWFDDRLQSESALALMLSGSVRMDTVTLHGLRPMSSYHTITGTDGDAVLTIDGRPALAVVDELFGPDSNKVWEDYPFMLVLGVNKGDPFGDFREQDYVNQLCIGVDREREALLMVEPYLKAGDEVQLMRRGIESNYIRERVEELFAQVGDRTPRLAVYIDCAGRTALNAGTTEEEAAEVQRAVAGRAPLLGTYSATEIACVGGEVQAQNWTGVLCVLSE